VEVRHLGGALAHKSLANGALGSLDAGFAVFAVGMAPTPEQAATVASAIDLLMGTLAPWHAERKYPNFAECGADASDFYPAKVFDRLRRIKAHYDPEDRIGSNHPILAR
jgi:hypothetical protein